MHVLTFGCVLRQRWGTYPGEAASAAHRRHSGHDRWIRREAAAGRREGRFVHVLTCGVFKLVLGISQRCERAAGSRLRSRPMDPEAAAFERAPLARDTKLKNPRPVTAAAVRPPRTRPAARAGRPGRCAHTHAIKSSSRNVTAESRCTLAKPRSQPAWPRRAPARVRRTSHRACSRARRAARQLARQTYALVCLRGALAPA